MKITWSANWDDDLGGSPEPRRQGPDAARSIADKVKFEFEQTFMFYLPRICEHCLNPSCAASCPSGAIYKRSEDGIVLVDQDRCRGWRMCVSGCPYKKIYFNHRTGKAEKCTFCFPRIEVGMPDRLLGDLRRPAALHRADALRRRPGARGRVDRRTSTTSTRRSATVLPRPERPGGASRAAEQAGIPRDWIDAAQRSPIYALINTYEVALPLHPEYRTMPMVWYIPPLSPVVDVVARHRARRRGHAATCSPPSTRCASRSSTSPSCSPPATPARSTRCCAARRDAVVHARHQPGPRAATSRSRPPSA